MAKGDRPARLRHLKHHVDEGKFAVNGNACKGKVPYSTKQKAESYIRRSGHPLLVAYPCSCGKYHVGHALGSKRGAA